MNKTLHELLDTIIHKFILGILLYFAFSIFSQVLAQRTVITGKVTDTETGDAIPFANVYFKGTSSKGTTTDFDGFFKIVTEQPTDSLIASFVGYAPKSRWVEKGKEQVINFQLSAQVTTLKEVVISAKNYENPAWEILRNVVKNKDKNDSRNLQAYQYESYNKIEID
nr:carboxypeptidase-like regulatory domain-containing protein [Thermoflexibacter sp.]